MIVSDTILESYADLYQFSVTRLNDFWMTIWEFTAVQASVHPSKVDFHLLAPWYILYANIEQYTRRLTTRWPLMSCRNSSRVLD